MKAVEVVLPLAVRGSYTYSVPEALRSQVERGALVVVQFAERRHYVGLVLGEAKVDGTHALKPLVELVRSLPRVQEVILRFWEWMAHYYMCEWGEVLLAALPAGIKLDHELWVEAGDQIDASEAPDILHQLPEDGWQMKELAVRMGTDFRPNKVQQWVRSGFIVLRDRWEKKHHRPGKKALRFCAEEERIEAFLRSSSAPRQKELVLRLWETIDQKQFALRSDLIPQSFSSGILKGLMDKGLVEEYLLDPETVKTAGKPRLHPLSEKQHTALNEIQTAFRAEKTVLLHGVTSSGKTEIYTHLIQAELQEQRQALFLLPEIALTTQMIERMKRALGDRVLVYHSKMPETQRSIAWQRIARGDALVILGARSALLLPFSKLGLIVVDEEHEPSYKQQDPAPRYQARDAAVYLAHLNKARILLGSATPSLESMENALIGRYARVSLLQRFGNRPMPEVQLLPINDMAMEDEGIGKLLRERIAEKIEAGRQVILFQNRRGFAPYIICQDCGFIPQCPNCDISLSFHRYGQHLRCHYCGHKESYVQRCKKCQSNGVHQQGIGTQRLEERLKALFPEVGIERLDTDSARGRDKLQRLIDRFESGKTGILIGTQMVTKGLDFRNVGLVGIISADDLLSFPDFRNGERAYQLIAQVSGRAGRGEDGGQVLIQTRNLTHPLLKDLRDYAYPRIYDRERYQRKAYGYPPFTRLIRILLAHKDKDAVHHAAMLLLPDLRKSFGRLLLGPEQPGVSRLKNRYLQQFLLKLPKDQQTGQWKAHLLHHLVELEKKPASKGLRIVIDVDPMQ